MKRVLTALVLIPLVLVLVFLGPRWLVIVATAVLAGLAAWEYLGLTEKGGAKPPRIAVLVAITLLYVGSSEYPELTAAIVGALSLGLLVYCAFRSPVERVIADAAVSVFCVVYVGLTLLALPVLREEANGPSLLTFLFCVVWAGDIVALYVGRAWGRHKLAPRLSPNKTWEGALGSVAGSLLAAGGLLALAGWFTQWNSAKLSYPEEAWYWLLLAVIVNIAAQLGDLAESALKRSVGVKDSGTLLPGHGGVLDRIDALLLAAPVLWYAQLIHQRF
ncbi:MAG TPA: phosphatidate cytidylyltransferase [Terracidiphilus sp.]|nr:phosphatidate cytidylyltransferase [Terracidiphilus sp.]